MLELSKVGNGQAHLWGRSASGVPISVNALLGAITPRAFSHSSVGSLEASILAVYPLVPEKLNCSFSLSWINAAVLY